MIRFAGVEKRFGEHVVLNGLDLGVQRSEKVAIIGPSGSGKSTILRILMTLESIDAGHVEIDGETLYDGNAAPEPARLFRLRRKVGMVFQHFNLFPHLTVLGNVTLAPRRVLQQNKEAAQSRARGLLQMVGLEDKESAYPASLSGGQKQRVAIARAMAMQPEILLFDEVTSALDPELVGEVLGVLRRLARETDTTMLIVTHQMEFAREIADRIVFIDEGRVIEEGPPEDLLREPGQERTRAFLRAVLQP